MAVLRIGELLMSRSSFLSGHFQAGDSPIEVVITPPHDLHDPQQRVIILHVTDEGVMMDFYEDGELMGTVGRTYDEWFDSVA